MCKVLIVPGVKPEKIEQTKEFIKQAGETMSYAPDNDGFGYASIYEDGSIYGEKWLKNADAFKVRKKAEYSESRLTLQDLFGNALKGVFDLEKPAYEEFGEKGDGEPVSFLVHARKKTKGEISLENTHPFYELGGTMPKTALIHNGTIHNHEKLAEKKQSTCDSESIMREWLKQSLYLDIAKIETLAKKMVGVYAVGVLSNVWDLENEVNYPAVDVFKSNKELFCAYIEELETYVFATTKNIIESGCRKSKFKEPECFELEDGHYLRIDAVTGDVVESIEFDKSEQYVKHTTGGTNSNGTTNYGHNNHHRPPRTIPGTTTNDEIKKQFEENNKELFLEYYTVSDLTAADRELIRGLEQSGSPEELRALNLVKMTLAAGNK